MGTSKGRNKKAAEISGLVAKDGAPGRIRTSDPQVRSLVLYPTELRARGEEAELCQFEMNRSTPSERFLKSLLLVEKHRCFGVSSEINRAGLLSHHDEAFG